MMKFLRNLGIVWLILGGLFAVMALVFGVIKLAEYEFGSGHNLIGVLVILGFISIGATLMITLLEE